MKKNTIALLCAFLFPLVVLSQNSILVLLSDSLDQAIESAIV